MRLRSIKEAINEKVTKDKVANKSKVNVDNKSVALQQKTIDLLAFLYVNKNKAHTRDDIMRALWGKESVGTRVIDIYIMDIRKKLGKDIIQSLPGVGYKFNPKYDLELSSSYPKEHKVVTENKTITFVAEAMDPNYKKWRKNNVTYRGTRADNPWPLDGINEYEGKFGKGLYTTPLSNKAMTKDYGKTWLIVGAIPRNPLKFRSINDAEIWLQQYAIKNGKGEDDIDKLRNFWKKHTIEDEMTKQGYDGILINGREMILFNPDKEKLRAFETERELEKWYDDFFSPSTEPVEWDGKGGYVDPKRQVESKNIVKTKSGQEINLDEYDAKQTILGTVYISKDRKKPKPSVFHDFD